MPRRLRVASGGFAYPVLNRAVGRMRIFAKPRDFEAFEEVIAQARERVPMRVLAWCVMSNHWHFVLWPRGDGNLSEFMRWLWGVSGPWAYAHGYVLSSLRDLIRFPTGDPAGPRVAYPLDGDTEAGS